jgi:hypothetical protein
MTEFIQSLLLILLSVSGVFLAFIFIYITSRLIALAFIKTIEDHIGGKKNGKEEQNGK